MPGRIEEFDRLIDLYRSDHDSFNWEKNRLIDRRFKIENVQSTYEWPDNFHDNFSEEIRRVNDHLSIYHDVEAGYNRDYAMYARSVERKNLDYYMTEEPAEMKRNRWKQDRFRNSGDGHDLTYKTKKKTNAVPEIDFSPVPA